MIEFISPWGPVLVYVTFGIAVVFFGVALVASILDDLARKQGAE